MRFLLLVFSFLLIISCETKNKNTSKLNWLEGKWERINNKPNKQTFEFWSKDLIGLGFTLQKKDTVFKEKMHIVNLKDTLYLKVEGVNKQPTFFKFTNQTDSSFVCKNPKNDFPKKIKYYLEYNYLKAEVSNDNVSLDFVFKRIKQAK